MPTVERDLRFQFKITPVTADEGIPHESGQWRGLWTPPTRRRLFARDDANSTEWYEWSSGGIRRLQDQTGPTDYRNCSIFFNKECRFFIVSESDCSESNLNEVDGISPWRRVEFTHVQEENNENPLSRISFGPVESCQLATRGHPVWLPELIPESYDNPSGYPGITHLTGELSILLGAAAFTCPPQKEYIIQTIRRSFRLPYWIPKIFTRAYPQRKFPRFLPMFS
jgi:hypothetical protein